MRRRSDRWLAVLATMPFVPGGAAGHAAAAPAPLTPYRVTDYELRPAGSPLAWNGELYFSGFTDQHTLELFKSDGTAAGTSLVKEINPGIGHANPQFFTPLADVLYFTADDGVHGGELWRTDGTASGTALVKDIYPGDGFSGARNLTRAGDTLFLLAQDNANGMQPWKSDGTEAGTVMLKLAATPETRPVPTHAAAGALGGSFFFTVDNTVNGRPSTGNGRELWRGDGTAPSTVMLKDINPGTAHGVADEPEPTPLGDHLYFVATPPAGQALYKTDGTEAGTVPVKPVAGSAARGLTVAGEKLFFRNDQGVWVSDGTDAGTQLLADPTPGEDYQPFFLTAVGQRLFFFADDEAGAGGVDLWVSDGSPLGTSKLIDALPPGTHLITGAAATDDLLFFVTHEQLGDSFSRSSPKLWVSDGTIAGTTMLLAPTGADVRSGNNSSIEALTIVGDHLFFGAPTTVDANGYNDGRTLHALVVPEPTGAAAAVLAGLTLLRRHQRRSPPPPSPPSSTRRCSRRT